MLDECCGRALQLKYIAWKSALMKKALNSWFNPLRHWTEMGATNGGKHRKQARS